MAKYNIAYYDLYNLDKGNVSKPSTLLYINFASYNDYSLFIYPRLLIANEVPATSVRLDN